MTLRFECKDGSKIQKVKLKQIWIRKNDNKDMLCFKYQKEDNDPDYFHYIFLEKIKTETISITKEV